MLTLSSLHIYPIKSLGGISLQEANVELRGLQYDRRWMLVDEDRRFVTQREIPEMARLRTAIDAENLYVFSHKNQESKLVIPLEGGSLSKTRVEVWSDKLSALEYPQSINQWFSEQLGRRLRLVWMPDSTKRRADGRYAPKGQYVSFADGFPFLCIGQASLDALNEKLPQGVPMDRFRPNFVFIGSAAFEEDEWSDIRIGQQPFRIVKPCARCMITTIDQQTASGSKEPLQTLSLFRKKGPKVLFGQNTIWLGEGAAAKIAVGDTLEILTKNTAL